MPAVLVHYHIYKNAGSSIDRLLRESFGDAWAAFDETGGRDIIDCAGLQDFLAAHPDLKAVSSHAARPPLPAPHTYPIVMLRHPVDRARSIYHFAQRDRSQPDHAVASCGGFREYVEHFLPRADHGVVIRNYQVVHLSDASIRYGNIQLAQATGSDLVEAKALLVEWGVFGIVRRFGDSCRLFEARYGRVFPELRLHEVRENVSTSAALSDPKVLECARAELGVTTFDRLIEANRLDLELYEYAQRLFATQLAAASPPEGADPPLGTC